MKEKKIVVGFWLRFVADCLDTLILALIGFLLSIPLGSIFFKLGESGLWVGLVISFLYCGILQSSIGQGQSLAKRLLGIQVVKMDGSFLDLGQSFLRYLMICLVFYNQWIGMGIVAAFPFLDNTIFNHFYLLFITALFLGIFILVGLHPLKRGIHDMMVGSLVIRKGMYDAQKIEQLKNESKEKRAFIICGAILIACSVLTIYLSLKLNTDKSLVTELMTYKQEVEQNTQLINVIINKSYLKSLTEAPKSQIGVSGFLEKSKFDNVETRSLEAQKVADIIVKKSSSSNQYQDIAVQIRTGYSIGIWSYILRDRYLFVSDGKLIHK